MEVVLVLLPFLVVVVFLAVNGILFKSPFKGAGLLVALSPIVMLTAFILIIILIVRFHGFHW